jgi:hypothetical protein
MRWSRKQLEVPISHTPKVGPYTGIGYYMTVKINVKRLTEYNMYLLLK